MDLQEIKNLIDVRDYVERVLNNYNRDKQEIASLRSMVILLDNKIVSMLLKDDFKEYVDFNNAKDAVRKAAENNNIKSGLKKS